VRARRWARQVRLAFAVFVLKPSAIVLALGSVSQKQYRGFREGPFQIGIANLLARGAILLTRGLLGTLDQTAIGDKILGSLVVPVV
jgi:hypothetical protein